MAKEYDIDCMKYRKSTHLAGVDVETIIAERGNCILTIKEAWYEKAVDVSGNKTDGYFISFVEGGKPMLVNSVNRKTIASVVKNLKQITSTESRNLGNWKDLVIELYFDSTIKMMGQIVGGIRIKTISPAKVEISDANGLAILSDSKTLIELQTNWGKLSKEEKTLPTILAKKELLKTKLQ